MDSLLESGKDMLIISLISNKVNESQRCFLFPS